MVRDKRRSGGIRRPWAGERCWPPWRPLRAISTAASAAPRGDIRIDDTHVYPESLSATADGTVYVGGIKGVVFRDKPGATMAEPWATPKDVLSILGVLADPANHTLWLCSTPNNLRNPPVAGVSALMALDLKTGKPKGVYPFPAPASACNDITVAKDGTAYASDTPNGRIFTLKRGAKALELFADDAKLKGIDGIAFSGDGTLYANIVTKGQMVRIERGTDGKVSGVTVLDAVATRRRAGRLSPDLGQAVPVGRGQQRQDRRSDHRGRPGDHHRAEGRPGLAAGSDHGRQDRLRHGGQDHLSDRPQAEGPGARGRSSSTAIPLP